MTRFLLPPSRRQRRRRRPLTIVVVLGFLVPSGSLAADEFYVAPGGNDDAPGSIDDPWATIQHAANTLQPGDTVLVRGGAYAERVDVNVSGSADLGPITIRNFPDEVPVLDGSSLMVPAASNGLFYLENVSYVVIEGFELRDYRTSTMDLVPVGIHVRGSGTDITIRDCVIHRIEHNLAAVEGSDAHGIAVFGTAMTPISNLVIEGNELFDLVLGSSEALVLNGNVEGFTVASNHLHDCNNIAIDIIGFEGTAPDPSVDQARCGVVRGNLVVDIDTLLNPAYEGGRSAGGVYVDGGRDILVERNEIVRANIGVEIASEMADRATSNVTVACNLVRACHVAGLAMGGYDEFRGSTENCTVVNNTFFRNDTDATFSGELLVQFDTSGCVVRNNVVVAGPQNVVITNPFVENEGNTFDDNLYFAPAGADGAEFEWKGVFYESFAEYQAGSRNDGATLFEMPGLVAPDASEPDLRPAAGSPVIDAGVDSAVPPGVTLDLDGTLRIQGNAVDLGCYESRSPCPGDVDGNRLVDVDDLVAVILAWGTDDPAADVNGDGIVDVDDLVSVVLGWGVCE